MYYQNIKEYENKEKYAIVKGINYITRDLWYKFANLGRYIYLKVIKWNTKFVICSYRYQMSMLLLSTWQPFIQIFSNNIFQRNTFPMEYWILNNRMGET